MARPHALTRAAETTGAGALETLAAFGRFWAFAAYAASFVPLELLSLRGWRRLLPQCFAIGTRSVPVIMLTGAFVGMVLVVQGYEQFDNSGFGDRIGAVVNVSVASELGPVLAGVMLAGRVGGALTAELGTMNVTEQLLALRSMGADPVRFLVAPRFLACLILTPLLTCYADLMGALGAWLVYIGMFGGESEPYWFYTRQSVMLWDLGTGLFKAFFFGGALGIISCYKGFHCKRGAEGVGRACTDAFVTSFITILLLDLLLGIVLNSVFSIRYGFRTFF
ncbi:MAG: ABC transporter permease [Phycisphaerae bacterium]|nr:ABC transporter permease [Phycisphaerae bacterium]